MAAELVQTKKRQIQNRRNALCSVSLMGPHPLLKVLTKGRVSIVLFVDLETQVSAENVVEVWHLIFIH